MSSAQTPYTAETWPIGANMLSFGSVTPGGTPTLEASSSVWASQLRQVKELGVDQIDPTDAWLPLAKLSDERVEEFRRVLDGEGVTISSISMTRNSVVDVEHGEQNFADALRFVELAPSFDVTVVNTGFMQATTPAQNEAIWFWLADGHVDDPFVERGVGAGQRWWEQSAQPVDRMASGWLRRGRVCQGAGAASRVETVISVGIRADTDS